MKNTFKRTLALALAVVMLLSVSVIGVSAEDTEVTLNGGVNTNTVTIYEFYQDAYKGQYLYRSNYDNVDADVATAYQEGKINWMRYNESAGYIQFAGGRPYMYVNVGEGKTTSNAFSGLLLKSPGAGTYDLSFTYSVTVEGCPKVTAYLVPQSVFDATTTAWRYVLKNHIVGTAVNDSIVEVGSFSCYDADETESYDGVLKATVELGSDKTYHLVFCADDLDDNNKNDGNKVYFKQLALEKTSADAVELTNKSIGFYTAAYGDNALVGPNAAAIKTAYEAENGTQDWRMETTSNFYQFRSAGNNKFNTSLKNPKLTLRMLHYVSTATSNQYVAFRVKSPGTGKFKVSLTYGANSDGAGDVGVYIIPASEIEKAVNTAGYVYSDLAASIATNFGNNPTATESYVAPVNNAINAVLNNSDSAYSQAVIPNVSFDTADHNTTASYTANNLVKEGSVITCAAEEDYIVVFKLEVDGAGSENNYLYLTALNFEQQAVVNNVATVGNTPYPTIKAALNAATGNDTVTLLADCAVADLGNTCNIELNGHKLTVYGDMTSLGVVSDSQNSTGVLKVTGDMKLLSTEQTQLPLYDETVGGYGLYAYTWGENNESEEVKGDATAKKFWFQFTFTNDKAYQLVASGTSGLEIGVVLNYTFDGEPAEKTCVFAEEDGAEAYAAKWAQWIISDEPTNPWFFVTVRNAVEGMSVTPYIAVGDTVVSCAAINY